MTGLLQKILHRWREDGTAGILRALAGRAAETAGYKSDLTRARMRIASLLQTVHGNQVAYGLFKGMALNTNGWWNTYDVSAMILGTYEAEVQARLKEISVGRNLFVALGAADGYYAIGVLQAGLFEKCICFEASEKGRNAIVDNARLNDVSGKIQILGVASDDFVQALPSGQMSSMVVLCDIEGAEYNILTRNNLGALRQAAIIVELHEFTATQRLRAERFLADAGSIFEIDFLRSGARDPSAYPELADLPDYERLLAFSEGRPNAMRWAVLTPRS